MKRRYKRRLSTILKIEKYQKTDKVRTAKRLSNKKFRENNHEYDIERKRQATIKKNLGEYKPMKKSVYIKEDFRSDKGNFNIRVESGGPQLRGALEIAGTEKTKEIGLQRSDHRTGVVIIKDEKELAELMLLLSEFSEVLEREKQPARTSVDLGAGGGSGDINGGAKGGNGSA